MENATITRNMLKLPAIDMFYYDTKSEGPVIICLHGRWGRAQTWYDFIKRYGARYRVIAPDQRGHGLSGKPVSKYTGEEMAGDIIDLMDALNIPSAIVAGHSMGGRVAGYFAALHPERIRAVAILDKSANGPEKPCALPPDQLPAIDPYTNDWPMPFLSLIEAEEFLKKAEDSDLSVRYFMNSLTETAEGYKMMFSPQAMAANVAYDESWFHLLPRIACPVLLVRTGSHAAVPDDDFTKMQSLIKDCIAREVSHPDHNVMHGNKEEFYRYFDEFLKKKVGV